MNLVQISGCCRVARWVRAKELPLTRTVSVALLCISTAVHAKPGRLNESAGAHVQLPDRSSVMQSQFSTASNTSMDIYWIGVACFTPQSSQEGCTPVHVVLLHEGITQGLNTGITHSVACRQSLAEAAAKIDFLG